MFDAPLRIVKDRCLEPVVALCQQRHLSPNMLSVAAFVLGLLCAVFASFGCIWTSVFLWSCNRVLDGADGAVARRTGRVTDFGGYLDILCDFTVYALVPVGLTWAQFTPALAVVTLLLESTYFVNAAGLFYLSAILEKNSLGASVRGERTSVTMQTAWIEGSETVLAYFLFLLFPTWNTLLFTIFGAGVVITIIQRALWAFANLDENSRHINKTSEEPTLTASSPNKTRD